MRTPTALVFLLVACSDRAALEAKDREIAALRAQALVVPADAAAAIDLAAPPVVVAAPEPCAFVNPGLPCQSPYCFQTVKGKNACWCSAGNMRYCIVYPDRCACRRSDFPPPKPKPPRKGAK